MSTSITMIHSVAEFLEVWKDEAATTQSVLGVLTDQSLGQQVTNDHRTLGRLAWHLTQTIPEMMGKTGLKLAGPGEHDPVPTSAKTIGDAYATASASLTKEIKAQWTDTSLTNLEEMYGEKWSRSFILRVLVLHQTHHRGQMSVLMRQAGLKVPEMYGPVRESWAQWKMAPPAI